MPAHLVSAQKRRESQMERLQRELRTAKIENEELNGKVDSLEGQRKQATDQIRKLENMIRNLRTEKATLEELMKEHDAQQDGVLGRLERAQEAISSLKTELKDETATREAEEKRALELVAEVRVFCRTLYVFGDAM